VPSNIVNVLTCTTVCDVSCIGAPYGIVAISTDLRKSDTFSELPIATLSDAASFKVHLCLPSGCQEDNVHKAAHLVHLSCWKLVNSVKESQMVTRSLFLFAESTSPFFDIGTSFKTEMRSVPNLTNVVVGDSAETEVGKLLKSLSMLPAEIRLAILPYCTQKLLLCLFAVLESSALLNVIKPDSSNRGVGELLCGTNAKTLSARSISIFGQSYIRLLSFSEHMDNGNDQHLVLANGLEVRGIKFVVDRYGLRAIRILYIDSSASPWLGDETGGWKGIIYGNSLRNLYVIRDVRHMKLKSRSSLNCRLGS
jgi:hypothetical protein